jgi:3-oxoacyl-[acyl-carrier-protein] synthase II
VDFPERILASKYGLGGPVAAFTSACSASAHAIGAAFHSIRSGRADIFLAGGCDAMITPLGLAGFCLLEVTTRRCEDAARACRPFDRTRDGTVIAEGAVVLVLEEYGCASRRGATPLAEVTGFGATSDAYRLTDTPPDGEGIRRAMVMALADAGIEGEQLDYINAHGTGTPQNDVSETRAFKALLGPRAASVPISSTKSMTGHMVAAAGAMEAAICVLALRHGIIFPTKNLRESDPECDLDYVPEKSRQANLRTILSNSCGLGGQNASLVFRKAD